jgi:type III pantothenate kinase
LENSVIFCDIGNTSFHFYEDGKTYKESVESFNPQTITKKVYFISVNVKFNNKLKELDNWIDLAGAIDKSKYYETMGVDRMVAVEAFTNAVIVDAGSAITVDVVRDGFFEGGFIYPGVNAMSETYKRISPALDYNFNFDLDIEKLPKNSQDAISYGFLKTLYSEVLSHSLPIVLMGGDAYKFQAIFKEARVDELLLFKSMKNLLKKL